MADFLEVSLWSNIGWGVIIVAVLLMIFRGKLVPIRYYEEVLLSRDQWKEHAQTGEEARRIERETNMEQARQIEVIARELETVVKLIDALPKLNKDDSG